MVSIVFAGGGTAGHISPLLAIAQKTRAELPDATLTIVGTVDGLETDLVPKAGFQLEFIDKVVMPRKVDKNLLTFWPRYKKALAQSVDLLKSVKADVLVGVGGYVSTPMYSAAKKLNIPYIVHEANAKAGVANKMGAKKAEFVGTTFENTDIPQGIVVGMPMRSQIAEIGRSDEEKKEARTQLGLDANKTTLIITGGSLGAQKINDTIAASVDQLLEHSTQDLQILHITGKKKQVLDSDGMLLSLADYHQREYLSSMELAYAAADLLIARSGAATVSEVAAVGVPAVFVPLPIGNGEQNLNAAGLVETGGAILVDNKDFTPQWVEQNVVDLLESKDKLKAMEVASKAYGKTDGADKMYQQIHRSITSL